MISDPTDFWGPHDMITMIPGLFEDTYHIVGRGPYSCIIPWVEGGMCECKVRFDLIAHRGNMFFPVIQDSTKVWDYVIKCPKCGKLWRIGP
ncbi:hypothetical protein DRQ26_07165 [bacterium]|nr:MAG: hypothetical protein DRQ26_07165 [bacterium]